MNSEIKSRADGQISVFIPGREPLIGVDFPTAIKELDKAYTEELGQLVATAERCISAMDSAITQLEAIRRVMDGVVAGARAKHLAEGSP